MTVASRDNSSLQATGSSDVVSSATLLWKGPFSFFSFILNFNFCCAQLESRNPTQDYSYLLLTNCHSVAVVCWVLCWLLELKNVAVPALVIKLKETI